MCTKAPKTEKPPFELTKDGFNDLVESLKLNGLQNRLIHISTDCNGVKMVVILCCKYGTNYAQNSINQQQAEPRKRLFY